VSDACGRVQKESTMSKEESVKDTVNSSEKKEVVLNCENNDAQLPKLTKSQLKEIDLYLGIVAKIVPLSFTVFVILGGVAIWLYLAKLNLTSEFSQLISTYQILFQISFFSLVLTALVVLALIIGPVMYRSGSDELYKSNPAKGTFVFDLLVIFFNMGLQLVLASNLTKGSYEWASAVLIIISATVIVTIRSKLVDSSFIKQNVKWPKKLYAGGVYFVSLFLMLLPLSLLLLAASKNLPETTVGYVVVILCLAPYSLIGALLIERNKKAIIVLIMLVLAPICIFQEQSINFFLKHYGLSQYSATMSFDNKYTTILDDNSEIHAKKIPKYNGQSAIYRDIWIILDVPSTIILSATSASRTFVELPKIAMTGKSITVTVPAKGDEEKLRRNEPGK
jgi:hypothetical protein